MKRKFKSHNYGWRKMNMLFMHVAILICTSTSIFGGVLKGTILDKKTKEAIPFANVMLENSNGIQKVGNSDFDGKFKFNSLKPGKFIVSVQSISYITIQINDVLIVDSLATILNINLEQDASEIQEIECVVYKKHLSSRRLKKLSKKNISNVTSPTTGGSINNSSIKGSRSCGTVTYIDGTKIIGSPILTEENQESYTQVIENRTKSPILNPLSTFSIDVDNASYTNCRRIVNQGQLPPTDAVRIEEFINYFDYDYEEPKDEHPFAIHTEVGDCPWEEKHKLVKIGIKGKEYKMNDIPPMNLVFLIDVSGSMSIFNKLGWVKESLGMLVDKLRAQDKVSIVVYAGAAGVILEPTSGSKNKEILSAIGRLEAGGSTAGGEGLKLAYSLAEKNLTKEGINRIILATDGDFNIGVSSDLEMKKIVEAKRDLGISITVLGYGMGNYKDSKMEIIADHGNGNYYYIDDLSEAQNILAKDLGATMFTIAKDVKLQIEFNPAAVKTYRLIGYENRTLKDEDFNNDAIDAGDLGAGHTVTALYELEALLR